MIKLRYLNQASLSEHDKHHLHNISPVQVVVVLNVLSVAALNLVREPDQFLFVVLVVYCWLSGQLSHQVNHEQRECIAPPDSAFKIKNIKVKTLRTLKQR
jgi:hypothetical protein